MLNRIREVANRPNVYRAYYIEDEEGISQIVEFRTWDMEHAWQIARSMRLHGIASQPTAEIVMPHNKTEIMAQKRLVQTKATPNKAALMSIATLLASTRLMSHHDRVNAFVSWIKLHKPYWNPDRFIEIANAADDKYVTDKQISARKMAERLARLDKLGIDTSPRYPSEPGKPRNGLEAREARARLLARSPDGSEEPTGAEMAPNATLPPAGFLEPWLDNPQFKAALHRDHRPSLAQAFPHLTKK